MKKQAFVLVLALLCGTAAHAQNNLTLEFESAPGQFPLGILFDPADPQRILFGGDGHDQFDLDGNGIPELVLLRDNEQGTPAEFVVLDMTSRTPIWTWELDEGEALFLDHASNRFRGFYTIYPDEFGRVAVFGGAGVLVVSPVARDPQIDEVVFSLDPNLYRLVGIADIDRDDLDEIIVGNVQTRTTQVWGAVQ
ncbi:MAG: hypothetical protein ACE5G0_09440 [Rhodothermales bacterium]